MDVNLGIKILDEPISKRNLVRVLLHAAASKVLFHLEGHLDDKGDIICDFLPSVKAPIFKQTKANAYYAFSSQAFCL